MNTHQPHDFDATKPGGSGGAGRSIDRSSTDAALPDHIGAYQILGVLGEGGMSLVYRALQERPRRFIALKIIRPGIVSPSLLRRFDHEVEILGRLQHAGIAQIYEAGAMDTEAGRMPFFAMELIDGRPLTEYANEGRLGIAERLAMMRLLCDAVHYAHQRGVIHRDLKPANILVNKSGEPRILDFGVARVTESDRQHVTMQTEVGQLVGTIPYMSPEQIRGAPDDLDTRSDVYALGVILFELLTGQLPYPLKGKTLAEAVRIVSEDEPSSLVLSNASLRGDLETIVTKALEKDKDRRYQSAHELGQDIARFQRDEPIMARPASAIYQMRKFARRNRPLVAGLAGGMLALIVGIFTTTWQAVRATRAEAAAVELAESESRQRELAEQRQAESESVTVFIQEMFSAFDPAKTLGREVTVRDVLDQATARAESDLQDQPIVRATVSETLGHTYRNLGHFEDAERLLRFSYDTRRRLLGDDDPHTLQSMNNLALALHDQGKLAEAEPLYRRAMEYRQQELGPEHPDTLMAMNNLGWLLWGQGKLTEAETVFQSVLETRRRAFGDDDPETLRTMTNLAGVLQGLGKLESAEQVSGQALEASERILGEKHPQTLYTRRVRISALMEIGRLADAEQLALRALELDRLVLGDDHPYLYYTITLLANVLRERAKLDDAERLQRQALDARRRMLGEEHADTLTSLSELGYVLYLERKYDEAETLFDEVLATKRRTLGERHADTLLSMRKLALVWRAQGKLAESEALGRRVVELREAVLGPDHVDTVLAKSDLAMVLLDRGETTEADALSLEAVEFAKKNLSPKHWLNHLFNVRRGICLAQLGRLEEAQRFLKAGYDGLSGVFEPNDHRVQLAVAGLVDLYTASGDEIEAEEWREKLIPTIDSVRE